MPHDLIDIRAAAALARRHPETVRRWVRSGRLRAERHGRLLMVDRDAVERLARSGSTASALASWAERARRQMGERSAGGRSAADLVIEDRRRRSRLDAPV